MNSVAMLVVGCWLLVARKNTFTYIAKNHFNFSAEFKIIVIALNFTFVRKQKIRPHRDSNSGQRIQSPLC